MSSDIFADQRRMMRAFECTTEGWNDEQVKLYIKLKAEEFAETLKAAYPRASWLHYHLDRIRSELLIIDDKFKPDKVEFFDGLIDEMVVTAGAGLSAGFPMQAGWDEVLATNMAKVDPKTGKVVRREDGKVQKPVGWTPPDLKSVLERDAVPKEPGFVAE
jgi:predicted HAD superfamily Cof-like phosphohydrolase